MNIAINAAALAAAPAAALASVPKSLKLDPIFELIEEHKQAVKDLDAHCRFEERLADTIPDEKEE